MNKPTHSEIVVRHKSEIKEVNQVILSQMDLIYDLFSKFNIHIAGGMALRAYRNQDHVDSDFDIFVDSDETGDHIINYVMNHNGVKLVTTANAVTLTISCYDLLTESSRPINYDLVDEAWKLYDITIQVILKQKFDFFHEVFDHFDIETCKIGYWKDHFIMTRHSEYLINNQYLEITKSVYDASIKHSRIIKYLNRGYAPTSKLFRELFLDHSLLASGFNINSDHMGGHDDYGTF